MTLAAETVNPVELVEHAPAVRRALPDPVGRALAAAGIVEAAPDPYAPGHWSLRAGSKIGAVAVTVPGGEPITVRVTPKVPIVRLFFLLGYSCDRKGSWREGESRSPSTGTLCPRSPTRWSGRWTMHCGKGCCRGTRRWRRAL